MPRRSERAKWLRKLRRAVKNRRVFSFIRAVFLEDDDSDEDDLDIMLESLLSEGEERRYHSRCSSYRASSPDVFAHDLNDEMLDGKPPWLNDSEFLQKYRCTRQSFENITKKIEDHDVFKKRKKGNRQAPVEHQLMVFLKYLGTEGSGASDPDLRNIFAIGKGTAQKYRDRCAKALASLADEVITWPDADERKDIAMQFFKEYGWPNLVSVADGTLFPFAFAPETDDAPDYSGRKYGYSLTAFIVCDCYRRIRFILTGWPGSTHDNRVFTNTPLHQERNKSQSTHF